jgi:plastocyanin
MSFRSKLKSHSPFFAGVATVVVAVGILAVNGRNAKAMPPQDGYTVQQVAGGTIQGKLLWVGKEQKPHRISVTQDRSACGSMKDMYDVRVEQGGVAGAVVSLDNITHGKAFDFPKPVLDQKGCMFVPEVVLMNPGKLEVENSDPVTHNVHIIARYNRSSNEMMAPGAPPVELTLMRPETIIVRCDIHTWMQGYIVVAKNPYYAVSGSGGSFTLTDVPAGTYTLDVWQSKIGTKSQSVTVQAGKTTAVTFKLGG